MDTPTTLRVKGVQTDSHDPRPSACWGGWTQKNLSAFVQTAWTQLGPWSPPPQSRVFVVMVSGRDTFWNGKWACSMFNWFIQWHTWGKIMFNDILKMLTKMPSVTHKMKKNANFGWQFSGYYNNHQTSSMIFTIWDLKNSRTSAGTSEFCPVFPQNC